MLFEWSLRLLEVIGLSSMYSSRTICTVGNDDKYEYDYVECGDYDAEYDDEMIDTEIL